MSTPATPGQDPFEPGLGPVGERIRVIHFDPVQVVGELGARPPTEGASAASRAAAGPATDAPAPPAPDARAGISPTVPLTQFQRAVLPANARTFPEAMGVNNPPSTVLEDLGRGAQELRAWAEERKEKYKEEHPFWAFDALLHTPEKIKEHGGFSEEESTEGKLHAFAEVLPGFAAVVADVLPAVPTARELASGENYWPTPSEVVFIILAAILARRKLAVLDLPGAKKGKTMEEALKDRMPLSKIRRVKETIDVVRKEYQDIVAQLDRAAEKLKRTEVGTYADEILKHKLKRVRKLSDGTEIRFTPNVDTGARSGTKGYGPNIDLQIEVAKKGEILARIELKLGYIPAYKTQTHQLRKLAREDPSIPHFYITEVGVFLVPSKRRSRMVRIKFGD